MVGVLADRSIFGEEAVGEYTHPTRLTVCRYAERNALRANLVTSAGQWPWGSLARRALKEPPAWLLPMAKWPVQAPDDWIKWVGKFKGVGSL